MSVIIRNLILFLLTKIIARSTGSVKSDLGYDLQPRPKNIITVINYRYL